MKPALALICAGAVFAVLSVAITLSASASPVVCVETGSGVYCGPIVSPR